MTQRQIPSLTPIPKTRSTAAKPARRLHDNVTGALKTLGVALATEASTPRCRRRRRSRSATLEFLHRLLAGLAEARSNGALQRRINAAKFRELTTLEDRLELQRPGRTAAPSSN